MFLTQEQVDLLTADECEAHFKKLSKKYNLNKPLTECWEEVWPVLDEITNTILYLEDRQTYLVQAGNAAHALKIRWGDKDSV